jgi:hypothetical protein
MVLEGYHKDNRPRGKGGEQVPGIIGIVVVVVIVIIVLLVLGVI